MFTKTRKTKRYGEKCGKTRKTGLLGRVHEINKRGEVMPENSGDGSYKWTFGGTPTATFASLIKRVKK